MITFVVDSGSDKEKRAYVDNREVHSEIIVEMMKDLATADVEIPVPEKYNKVIGNYINFLHNRPTEIRADKQKLLDCFLMSTYYLDVEYFKYLIDQLLLHWPENSGNYSRLLIELKDKGRKNITYLYLLHDINTHLPLNLIATDVIVDAKFIKEWLAINCDKNNFPYGSQLQGRMEILYSSRTSSVANVFIKIQQHQQQQQEGNYMIFDYTFYSDYDLFSEVTIIKDDTPSDYLFTYHRWYPRSDDSRHNRTSTTKQLAKRSVFSRHDKKTHGHTDDWKPDGGYYDQWRQHVNLSDYKSYITDLMNR